MKLYTSLFAVAAIMGASTAAAAGLSIIPGTPLGSPTTVPGSGGGGGTAFAPLIDGFGNPVDLNDGLFQDSNGVNQVVPGVTPVTTFNSGNAGTGGLQVTGSGSVFVTFLGFEAAFFNSASTDSALTVGGAKLEADNAAFGDSFSFVVDQGAGTSFVDFQFSTFALVNGAFSEIFANNNGPITEPLLLSFTDVFSGTVNGRATTSVIAFFEDKGASSLDIDDMVVRLDFAPIPLPAGAWLFLTAMGGLGIIGRRRATKVQA